MNGKKTRTMILVYLLSYQTLMTRISLSQLKNLNSDIWISHILSFQELTCPGFGRWAPSSDADEQPSVVLPHVTAELCHRHLPTVVRRLQMIGLAHTRPRGPGAIYFLIIHFITHTLFGTLKHETFHFINTLLF